MHDSRLSSLAGTGWLATTPAPFKTSVLAGCRVRTFARGESVYGFDDPPGGLWALAEGAVAIEVASMEHGLHVAHVLHPGAWMGEAALLTKTPRRVGVVAVRPSVLGFVSIADFTRIADADPEAWRWLALLAVIHTDIAIAVANDLMIRDTTARVGAVLLHLAGCRGGDPDRPAEIDLSQSDLARMTALSRTALAAQLKRLRAQGLIDADYRRIRIMSPARLRGYVTADVDAVPVLRT
jgi:CRP-like cAMP-binding protein